MPKPASIAAPLVRELTACRIGGEYPIRLDRLAARLDPPAEPGAVLKAVGTKAFTGQAIAAVKGRMDSPAALLEDLALLTASPLTLEVALRARGEQGNPPWAPKQLAAAVQKPLKAPLQEILERRLQSGELPGFAVRVGEGNAAKLYHRDRAPPPPPPKPEVQDAERLLDLLRRRQPGGEAALVNLAELGRSAGLTAKAFAKALKQPAFAGAASLVKVKPDDTFVVPNEGDAFARLVCGPLLARLLAGCDRPGAHAFPPREVAARLKDEAQRQLAEGLLSRRDFEPPAGVGCVLVGGKKGMSHNYFFRLEHLRTAKSVAKAAAAPPPSDFAAAFDAAFARLDRERGSNNFVSLVDLRAALPGVPRETFDAGLRQLRRDRRYVLASDERYEGLTTEQQAAAIREEGEFLLHVSRGRP